MLYFCWPHRPITKSSIIQDQNNWNFLRILGKNSSFLTSIKKLEITEKLLGH